MCDENTNTNKKDNKQKLSHQTHDKQKLSQETPRQATKALASNKKNETGSNKKNESKTMRERQDASVPTSIIRRVELTRPSSAAQSVTCLARVSATCLAGVSATCPMPAHVARCLCRCRCLSHTFFLALAPTDPVPRAY